MLLSMQGCCLGEEPDGAAGGGQGEEDSTLPAGRHQQAHAIEFVRNTILKGQGPEMLLSA